MNLWGEMAMNSMVLWLALAGISEREKHINQRQENQTKRGALHLQLFMENTDRRRRRRRRR